MSSSNRLQSSERSNSMARESFKCTAPCLYLPVFSKRKSVVHLTSEKRGATEIPEELNKEPEPDNITDSATNEVLRASSFDHFARSSCNSGIVFNPMSDEEGWKSPLFDLPVELIKSRNSDIKSPVDVAFVFSCDPKKTVIPKRALLIAQSKSLQLKCKSPHVDPELTRPSFSCPGSPMQAIALKCLFYELE